MRKRERENPCGVCGHYHKYEEGEVCGVCGHRIPDSSEKTSIQVSAFPSEILPEFLYLGSYDNASRSELLKTQGISRVLNVRIFYLFLIEYILWNLFCYHWGSNGFFEFRLLKKRVKLCVFSIWGSKSCCSFMVYNLSCHCYGFA